MLIPLFAAGRNPDELGYLQVRRNDEGRVSIMQPFGYAQGHEPVERQMGVFRQSPNRFRK